MSDFSTLPVTVVQQAVNGDWQISGFLTMEMMKISYLLLDGASDNSVLIFLSIKECKRKLVPFRT